MSANTNMGHVTSFEVWEIETAHRQLNYMRRWIRSRITCSCGKVVWIHNTYRCLYCDIWFCVNCAGEHFGETKAAFLERKAKDGN